MRRAFKISEMKEEQPNFKVTDRRLFNADGTPREIEQVEEAQTTETQSAAAQATTPSSSDVGSSQTETRAAAPAQSAAEERAGAVAQPQETTGQASAEDVYAEDVDVPGADDPASFVNFLMSIASNAAASLGMMEHPVTGERSVDLQLAKHWIDVLGMLKEKTRGNLALQEQQIFEGLLSDLRLQYVSLTSAPSAPQGKRGGFSGRDITGGR